jgi:hypothetical protein
VQANLQLVELAPEVVTAQPLPAALANALHGVGYARTLIYQLPWSEPDAS